MRILFDQGVPEPLRQFLAQHVVSTAHERGWSTLPNGELLDVAEREGFDVFVPTDTKLRHQQTLSGRSLAVVILGSTSWPRIQQTINSIVEAIDSAAPGSYTEVHVG